MRSMISIGAVGSLAVVVSLVSLCPAVGQSAAAGPAAAKAAPGQVVTIDPAQLPLPVRLPGNLLVVVPASDLNPYQETRVFNWITAPCNFGGQACEVAFSAVPAGKRLVVKSISGELVVNAGAAVRSVRLFSSSSSWHVPTVLQSTFLDAATHAVNSQLLAHFEAGQVPRLFINTDAINLGFNNEVTISGHFVQLP